MSWFTVLGDFTNVHSYKAKRMEIPWRIESLHPYRMDTRTHIQLLSFRHNNIMAHKLVLWEPINAPARRVRKTITYVDTLKEDSGLDI